MWLRGGRVADGTVLQTAPGIGSKLIAPSRRWGMSSETNSVHEGSPWQAVLAESGVRCTTFAKAWLDASLPSQHFREQTEMSNLAVEPRRLALLLMNQTLEANNLNEITKAIEKVTKDLVSSSVTNIIAIPKIDMHNEDVQTQLREMCIVPPAGQLICSLDWPRTAIGYINTLADIANTAQPDLSMALCEAACAWDRIIDL